ncbi:MAG: DegT/DnrJ/EryC1/StrS family aminotransferase [bacterium]|nr:DegT/DnrJ/EryC1/StrS family aminotransferase [bacterium]
MGQTNKQQRKITVGTVKVGPKAIGLVVKALEAGRISSGTLVQRFEQKFAAYYGDISATAVSSGTDADTVAYASLFDYGAQRGDEIIIPALAFISVANSAMHVGLQPVFVDINRENYNINPSKIEEAITDRTRAIVAVHNFGRPCDMDAIMDIARRHGLTVIEDCAEAHGAKYKGFLLGTIGAMGTFSFYVAHILTTGEGGMLITDDPQRAEIFRSLRAHGRSCVCRVCIMNTDSAYCSMRFSADENGETVDSRFFNERIGFSAKMNEMEAALGIEAMEQIDEIIAARREIMAYFNDAFERYSDWLHIFEEGPGEYISPLSYPLLVQLEAPFTRSEITKYLERKGIDTRPAFGCIPTQQPAYSWMDYEPGDFPEAEYVGKNGFYIGCHQNIDEEDRAYVVKVFEEFLLKFNG